MLRHFSIDKYYVVKYRRFEMKLRRADRNDIDQLVKMNLELMEDEQFDRPLEETQLRERMERFITDTVSHVFLIIQDTDVAGYAIVETNKTPIYLRHFFIKRNFREKHLGTGAFKLLLNELKADRIDLDVMVWNKRGYAFWKSIGFTERCYAMTYQSSV